MNLRLESKGLISSIIIIDHDEIRILDESNLL